MGDGIYWARGDDLTGAIKSLTWPTPSYMYLERVPTAWLSDAEIAEGVRLEYLDIATSFQRWERGRVFCADFELRWETSDGAFQMVYVGPEPAPPDFTLADDPDLNGATLQLQSYYLWGNHISADKLDTVGASERPGLELFIEFKVPRLLYYPVSERAKRAQLEVVEYLDPDNGDLLYYRFCGLKEA